MHSPATVGLSRERMIESCRAIVEALKDYDRELFVEVSASRSESESLVVTTGGVCHSVSATRWSMGGFAQRTDGTDMLFAEHRRGWRDVNEYYDPDKISARIIEDLRNGEAVVDPPTGRVTTVLSPEIFELLLTPIEMGVSGRNVAKGDSPLRGRLGEQVLDSSLTIVDDPHRDYCIGAAEIDGDGVPTRVIPIITGGVLENFLYDLDSAGLANAEPTGNTACQPYSLDVKGGGRPSREILADIEDGLYIKGLIGFGQSNIINGDFSCNVGLGYRIRGGEIIGRVKDTMVAGNVYELFKGGLELSSDRDELRRIPYACIEGLSVSAGRQGR